MKNADITKEIIEETIRNAAGFEHAEDAEINRDIRETLRVVIREACEKFNDFVRAEVPHAGRYVVHVPERFYDPDNAESVEELAGYLAEIEDRADAIEEAVFCDKKPDVCRVYSEDAVDRGLERVYRMISNLPDNFCRRFSLLCEGWRKGVL